MDPEIVYTIKAFILPPGLHLVMGVMALLVWPFWRRAGLWLAVFTLFSLYLMSTPGFAHWFYASLDRYPVLTTRQIQSSGAQAIVVPGAGRYANASEYGGDTVSQQAMLRLRYAAHVYRLNRLPILVAGGAIFGEQVPESTLMSNFLAELSIPVHWRESRSRTTLENARYTWEMLSAEGIDHIMLVSDAWHLMRAVEVFERQGFTVVPAPTGNVTSGQAEQTFLKWLPDSAALARSRWAMHEYVGRLWYWLRSELFQ